MVSVIHVSFAMKGEFMYLYMQVKGYIDLARQEGCSILCGNGTEELQLPERNKNVSTYGPVL